MSTYTVDYLRNAGPQFALAMLLQHIGEDEEPFVTYGAVAGHLEDRLAIPTIFPTHIGAVAGSMMDRIIDAIPNAPLINGLVTRPDGLPGRGFGGYYNKYLRRKGARSWPRLSRKEKLDVVGQIRGDVRAYEDWIALYQSLFGVPPERNQRPRWFTEQDGKPPAGSPREGAPESPEHKRLKEWVASNGTAIGVPPTMGGGTPEVCLLSGDRVYVVFSDRVSFVVVEVKSILSSDDDIQRGIYQCVKYRAVLAAQQKPVETGVRAILVTEREPVAHQRERATALNVRCRVVAVNSQAPPRPRTASARLASRGNEARILSPGESREFAPGH